MAVVSKPCNVTGCRRGLALSGCRHGANLVFQTGDMRTTTPYATFNASFKIIIFAMTMRAWLVLGSCPSLNVILDIDVMLAMAHASCQTVLDVTVFRMAVLAWLIARRSSSINVVYDSNTPDT